MKIEIESIIYGYAKTEVIDELNSLLTVISYMKLKQFTAYFDNYNSENFFLYKGGNHISVHQKYNNGEAMGNRLLFCHD